MTKRNAVRRACKAVWRGIELLALVVAGAIIIIGVAALFMLAPVAMW